MFLALVSSAAPGLGILLSVVQGGVPGKKRGTPQFSGPWALMGTARHAKQALTMWEHKQVLRKTPETPGFYHQCQERLVQAEDKQSQFCKWHIQVCVVVSADKCLSVPTGIF